MAPEISVWREVLMSCAEQGKTEFFLQRIWIYILGERKVIEFFSNENLNKEILDHTSPPPLQNLLRCLQISF